MGLAATKSGVNLLYAVFGMMLGILLVSGIIGRIALRKLIADRDLPEHAVVGQPITLNYRIQNQKRWWPSMSVTLAEIDGAESLALQPHAYLLHVAAGKNTSINSEGLARRRGLHQFDQFQLITSFPFGFIRRAIMRSEKDSLLVYPAIGRVDPKLIEMCQSAESSGSTIRHRRGGSDEFYGVKEYRAGENPRWIYWRRSAHTGTLVAKEMTHVAPPRLMLLVDTQLADRSLAAHADVERAIAMAASLASKALEMGLPVGLIAWRDGWVHMPLNRGKRHGRDLLMALATLPTNFDHGPIELLQQSRRHERSSATAILLTPQDVRSEESQSPHSRLLIVPVHSRLGESLFEFQKSVNFKTCMPTDETVDIPEEAGEAAAGK